MTDIFTPTEQALQNVKADGTLPNPNGLHTAAGGRLVPHPDGKPWTKCCNTKDHPPTGPTVEIDTAKTCMCFMRKPREGKSRFQRFRGAPDVEAGLAEKARFMCPHRMTEDGYHRECGGWAAVVGRNKEAAT